MDDTLLDLCLTFDKDKIIAGLKDENIECPEDDESFWAGIHYSICKIYKENQSLVPEEKHKISKDWLKNNNYEYLLIEIEDNA